MKRSRIFPGSQKPEMEGVYERNYGDDLYDDWHFCAFRNGLWRWGNVFVEMAAIEVSPSDAQCLPWRGLATRDGK